MSCQNKGNSKKPISGQNRGHSKKPMSCQNRGHSKKPISGQKRGHSKKPMSCNFWLKKYVIIIFGKVTNYFRKFQGDGINKINI